ncbi:MAG TPA: EAL domain-containing protein [Baekduia sp.]|nr:EAL domain-containing protein [Baekduia sp.]
MDDGQTGGRGAGVLGDAEARFRSAFEEAGIGMAIVGLDGRFLRVNRELARILGRTVQELLDSAGIAAVSHLDDLDSRLGDFARLIAGEMDRYQRDRRYAHADGRTIWGATTLSLVRDEAGGPLYAIGQLEDITARRAAEDRAGRRAAQQSALARLSQLALTEQRFPALARATVRSITEILDVTLAGLAERSADHDGLRFVIGAHSDDAGDSAAARLDERHALHTLAEARPVVVRDTATETRFDVAGLLARGLASGVTVPVAGEDAEPFGVLGMYATAPRAFDDDDLAFLQSVANVLTAALRRIAAERGLRHQSLHDPLTKLPNRALLLDRLRLALARGRRARTWTAVLYLDVDDFKNVNDSLGHVAGDELLRELAPRLSDVLRPSDTLARLGGDEFAVLCEGLDEVAESAAIAERLLDAAARSLTLDGVELQPTACIGIALVGPDSSARGDDLLRDADVAMYRAKRVGRGRYELFDDGMRAETIERVALTNDLRRAIERSELRLVYQPVVRFSDRRVAAFEALVRWTHPERGEIPPGRFIPLAEQHGLIAALGTWVLHEALDQQRRWREAGLALGDMSMSVNVSRVQLSRPELAADVLRALAERGLSPDHLMLEVTESAVMEDPDVAHATLRTLNQAGVRIALDDFGVGQSSLACLRDLPLDVLKLDRLFITSLATSRQAVAIVRAVTDMARTLGFSVVAEGIETEAQGQVVEALGCDIGQGYLYARPVPPAAAPGIVAQLDAALGGAAAARVA